VAVRQAFFDALRAQEEVRIHDQHVDVAQQAIQAARIKYTVGKIPQVEILKAQLAMARLAEHMARFEQDGAVARARLNTLMSRAADAPIEVMGQNEAVNTLPTLEALQAVAMEHRPDLMQARAMVEKSRAEQTLAKRTYAPDFSVSAGYMLMPTGSDARNTYAVEGSMSLPWLNRGKHDAELGEAAAAIHEKDAELDAMRNAARGEIAVALVRAQAAQRLERLYRETLRAQAEETLHAAVIAYESDQTSFLDLLDSQMAVVDIDQAWVDAAAELNSRMVDLEMATGAPLSGAAGVEEKK
jgi:outer membrane protein TolC